MPDRCATRTEFRTRSGRCTTANPWVQWVVHQGGMGGSWPPAPSYAQLAPVQRVGLRDATASMTNHSRDARALGVHMCDTFHTQDPSPLETRDGRVNAQTLLPQRTLYAYPAQKHLKCHRLVLRELGWRTGNPDGAQPNDGPSFTVNAMQRILAVVDRVYFRSTLLARLREATGGRELTLRVVLTDETAPRTFAYYSHVTHTITMIRQKLCRRVLPIVYEEVQHDTYLDFVLGILQHELTHAMCFKACPHARCNQRRRTHGQQFQSMMRHMWARGVGPAGPQAIPPGVEVLELDAPEDPLWALCRRSVAYRAASEPEVFTVAFHGACLADPTPVARRSPRTSSPRNRRRTKRSPSPRRRLAF
jgi:hypothetical protein